MVWAGKETPLVWPPRWTARFTPSLEVLNDRGSVRFRAGDQITSICPEGKLDDPASVAMIDSVFVEAGGTPKPGGS